MTPAQVPQSASSPPPRRGRLGAALALLVLAAAAAWLAVRAPSSPAASPAAPSPPAGASSRADFVGAAACAACHEREQAAWTGSHHQLAMQVADEATVLGDFGGATFEHFGVTSTFFRRDGRYFVRTDGPDGALAEFEITHTFGVAPLQQYLVPFPGGRLQALGIAWDSRPADAGGQRWFHLYPNEPVDHADQLHWTGLYQNWNLMCAECHSTDLRKGYDVATGNYATTSSEMNVACEACHGPGRAHVAWARAATPPYPADGDDGLTLHLNSDWAGAWTFPDPASHFPVRQKPLDPALSNVCAACHARRSTLVEGAAPGAPLSDSHRLSLLTDPNYHVDGQQHDEVYTWGSFLQSRMHARGVTCVDCHDPHSLQPRQQGNLLCARCHKPEQFDTPSHHFHAAGSAGASCVACHMPTRTYMVVHDRLDHSLRVPRPDLAATLGTPDACTQCHHDKQPAWAATAMDGWYGPSWRQRPQWGPTLQAGALQDPAALSSLLALAGDATATQPPLLPATPGIVRATAALLAQPLLQPSALPQVLTLLQDTDELVRIEALGLLDPFDAPTRAAAAAPLLDDPVRGVRIEAARLLADVPDGQLAPDRRAPRAAALDECLAALALNADWPAENVNRGNLELRRGRPEDAAAAYRRALDLDPRFVGAAVNLAEVLRQLGRDADGEPVLREALKLTPDAADLHHALGLLLVRRKDTAGSLVELDRAASLAPANGRYAWIYAVALNSAGHTDEALAALHAADARNPRDPEILGLIVSILRDRAGPGDAAAALAAARRLAELLPGNAQVTQLVNELEQQQ